MNWKQKQKCIAIEINNEIVNYIYSQEFQSG